MQYKVPFSQKLIPFLQEKVGSFYSGKSLRKALEANCCKVNGKVERFGSISVQKGDLVELVPGWEKRIAKEKKNFSFEILFEDESTVWIDKPLGLICDPEECQRYLKKDWKLIHRLDRETTGVLGFAKNEKAFLDWKTLFQEKRVKKSYLAFVDGTLHQNEGVIHTFLSKKGHFQGQTIWGSSHEGQEAITFFEKVSQGKNSSLLLCRPVTGRTHQIRVHLKEMGHPILIDRQYASSFQSSYPASRVLLHALELETASFKIKAKIPKDLEEAILWMQSAS